MTTIYQDFNRAESIRRGIDPAVTEAAWNTEGGLTEPARVGKFSTGWSWWAAQLHYGGEGYEQYGTTAGMGNGFTAKTGWAPGDPAAWRDALRYALDRVKASGWGPWYGPRNIGIVGMRGVDPNFYWAGTPAHEWDYLKEKPVPPLPYNPDARIDVQNDDFSCSIQATEWMLRSIGRDPGDAWIAAQLIPSIVSTSVGLKNGTGKELAEWITATYGNEMGFVAQYSPVSFDDVAAGAGVNPTLVGGHHYGNGGHWVGVRRKAADGTLELANSAPDYTGTGPTLDRAEWDARGPWDAIWIDRASTLTVPPVVPVPPTPPPFDRAAVIEKIKAIMALMAANYESERREWQSLLDSLEAVA